MAIPIGSTRVADRGPATSRSHGDQDSECSELEVGEGAVEVWGGERAQHMKTRNQDMTLAWHEVTLLTP